MQDSKEISWASDYSEETQSESVDSPTQSESVDSPTQSESVDSGRGADLHSNGSSDVDTWQQYRKWVCKAPVPKERRGGIDPSLYTWKGYRNWTEQIKRNWSEE